MMKVSGFSKNPDIFCARECFKGLIIKASVLKIPPIPLTKGDFEQSGSLLIKEG
jgi:hypothetical protein